MLQSTGRSCPTFDKILAYTGNIVAPGPGNDNGTLVCGVLALVLNCMMFVRGGGLQILIRRTRGIFPTW